MKIAIQGHPTRGKEVIQILESLGGKNRASLKGDYKSGYYGIYKDTIMILSNLKGYKRYTIEKFEKEFPFKIGDKVIFPVKVGWLSGKITGLTYVENVLKYEIDTETHGYHYVESRILGLYPMKKERNITLTLDKAKEWYNKSGELKEIALQAYSEEELTKVELPKTWEEFCEKYPVKVGEAWMGSYDVIYSATMTQSRIYKNWIPSRRSAGAHLALIQLEQLRDCYRGLFVTVIGMPVWSIIRYNGKPHILQTMWGKNHSFLSFQSKEVAEEYLKNFKPLIEKAGDLI